VIKKVPAMPNFGLQLNPKAHPAVAGFFFKRQIILLS
jgi:hypothetical protein